MSKTINFLCFQKLKFMEPSRVWYQVTPRTSPTISVPPPENQLTPWNVSDGPWVRGSAETVVCALRSVRAGAATEFIGGWFTVRPSPDTATPSRGPSPRNRAETRCRAAVDGSPGPGDRCDRQRYNTIRYAINSLHIRFYFLVFLVS